MRKWILAATVAALPVGAYAQNVSLKRGEVVTMTLARTGNTLKESNRSSTVPNNFEIAASAELQRGDYDQTIPNNQAVPPQASGALAPKPEPDKIILRFLRTPGKDQSILSVQNGYDRALVYRAVMHVGEDRKPTDVCLVTPGAQAVEHWALPIDVLDLSELRLVA